MTTNPTSSASPRLRIAPEPPARVRLTGWQRMQAQTCRQTLVETEAVSLADCDPRDMGRIVGRLESACRVLLDVIDTVTEVSR